MAKKKLVAVLSVFMLLTVCAACGKTENTTSIPEETKQEETQKDDGQRQEQQEEKHIVQPITNGGNLDVGNGY